MAPDVLAGYAAGLCYNSGNLKSSLNGAMSGGHTSVTEHASFTFYVDGVSRALLAQLTRHRIASFSVQSQRYVSMADDFEYATPPAIVALGSGAVEDYNRQMRLMHDWYCQWQERLGGDKESSNEDARMVPPNATCTRLLVTMNCHELLHFFDLRCCNRAQWEIREMAWQMLKECKKVAPRVFRDAGPGCVRGRCPEGKRACGKPYKKEGTDHEPITAPSESEAETV